MKIKQKFILREIVGDFVLVPITSKDDVFEGIISFNETGAFIWREIEKGLEKDEIIESLMQEYDVERDKAVLDVNKICSDLKKLGILEC